MSEIQQLENAIATLDARRDQLGDAVVDAALGPMRARLETLRREAFEPPQQTLRQVSILFFDVVGSTHLSHGLDPEEISAVLDGALARATTVVLAHDGRVLQYAGDNLLAAFGTHEIREDDAERAVRCGLALLALGRDMGVEVETTYGHEGFDVRVGVHTGAVLLGGGVDHGATIRGMAVNIAARMEQSAPAGALRISQDTYSLIRGIFDVLPQDPIAIKGVDSPVVSYFVQRVKPRAFRVESRGIEGIATAMIGRHAELAALQGAFERVVQPGARLESTLVVAEAGVGKSRLLHEFRNWTEAQSERFLIFEARASPQTPGQAHGLLRDLFAWRLRIADSDSMDVARRKFEDGLVPLFDANDGEDEALADIHLLGQLLGLDYDDSPHVRGIRHDAQQIRARGFHAAAQALRRFSARGGLPVVAFIDDMHWADDGTLDFLSHLIDADADVPILIVGLSRPTLFDRSAFTPALAGVRIDVRPLDDTSSLRLADEMLKCLPEVPAALRAVIVSNTSGNPFYMEEVVRMLIDQGAIDTTGAQWRLDETRLLATRVPPTLTGVLQARLDGLLPAERNALQLASVIGLNFWDAALAHIDASATLELDELVRRDLVTLQDDTEDVRTYAFQHQILHQVTYDTVLKRIRRHAHSRTAQWLAEHSGARAKTMLATAAEHYERAGDEFQAAEFYTRAAEYSAATFANDAALDYIARALALVDPARHGLRWRLIATRERTLDLLGRRAEQSQDIDALQALADALDDDAKRGESAWRRSDLANRTGDWVTQEEEARRALLFAERAGHDELYPRALQRLAIAVALRGDPEGGRAMAEEGLVVAERRKLSCWRLANAANICAELQGDRVALLHYAALSATLSSREGDRRAEAMNLSNLGNASGAVGQLVEGRLHLQEAYRLSRLLGDRHGLGQSAGGLAEIALQRGEHAQALTHAREGLAILSEIGTRLHVVDALMNIGNATLGLGLVEQASEAFERAEEGARAVAYPAFVLNAIEGRLRTALASDDLVAASALASRLLMEAGLDAATSTGVSTESRTRPFAGSVEHRIRLTLHRFWSSVDDPRANAALVEAHRALQADTSRIEDPEIQESFLGLPDHREIAERWRRRRSH